MVSTFYSFLELPILYESSYFEEHSCGCWVHVTKLADETRWFLAFDQASETEVA